MKPHRSWKDNTIRRYELETDEQYNNRLKQYAIKAISHNKYLRKLEENTKNVCK